MTVENSDLRVNQITIPHEISINRAGIKRLVIASSLRNGCRMPYYGSDFHLQIEREDGTNIDPHDLRGEETVGQIISRFLPEEVE